jgi:hypothetical protein
VRIKASGGLSQADLQRMIKDAEAHAKEDKKRKTQVEAKNHAEALVHSTEKALSEHGSKVGESDRRAIENALANLKEALKGTDAEAITAKANALAQVSMKLGEAIYPQSACKARSVLGPLPGVEVDLSQPGIPTRPRAGVPPATMELSAAKSETADVGAKAGKREMARAICFKCGGDKRSFFAVCGACGLAPRTEDELCLSLALCRLLSTEPQLAQFSREIKSGQRANVPPAALDRARQAVHAKLPTLLEAVDSISPRPKTVPRVAQGISADVHERPATVSKPILKLQGTALHRNPFFLLGATTRDDRQRIVELAEQKLLELDQEVCQKARNDLTNPRARLTTEMAWFPGVSPNKASHLLPKVLQDPMSVRSEAGLPLLAHANLMAAAFEAIDTKDDPSDVANFIEQFATLVENITVADVLRDINEDRAVSSFPEITSVDQIESELVERKRSRGAQRVR